MKDLIVKYRPKSFSELWTMGGGVQEILAFLRTETLPIGLVLHGGYGCGKRPWLSS